MSNGLTFEILNIINFREFFNELLGFEKKMTFAKFQGNRFRSDGEISENHVILVDHTFLLCLSAVGLIMLR